MALIDNPVINGDTLTRRYLYNKIDIVKPKAADIKTNKNNFILVLLF